MKILPRDKPPSLWERFKWKARDVWTFIRNIPNNVVMIVQWIPVLWSNWDWDYNYLLVILQYKLKRMQKHTLEHDMHTKSKEHSAQLQMCVDIIERLMNRDYTEKEDDAHNEKWGELVIDSILMTDDSEIDQKYGPCYTMDMYTAKSRELGLEEQERTEQRALYDLAEKRRQKDLDVLFRVMRKRIEHWWC